jgi:DNA polymerase-3 subunit epsilon
MHPGQRNSLDALCKRYSVDNSNREYHGALLDARILAEVYLAMTGGQGSLILSAESETIRSRARESSSTRSMSDIRIVVVAANDEENAAHEHILALLDKTSSGQTVWRRL